MTLPRADSERLIFVALRQSSSVVNAKFMMFNAEFIIDVQNFRTAYSFKRAPSACVFDWRSEPARPKSTFCSGRGKNLDFSVIRVA